jgi:hypothetical protein
MIQNMPCLLAKNGGCLRESYKEFELRILNKGGSNGRAVSINGRY